MYNHPENIWLDISELDQQSLGQLDLGAMPCHFNGLFWDCSTRATLSPAHLNVVIGFRQSSVLPLYLLVDSKISAAQEKAIHLLRPNAVYARQLNADDSPCAHYQRLTSAEYSLRPQPVNPIDSCLDARTMSTQAPFALWQANRARIESWYQTLNGKTGLLHINGQRLADLPSFVQQSHTLNCGLIVAVNHQHTLLDWAKHLRSLTC